jgi:protein TonB
MAVGLIIAASLLARVEPGADPPIPWIPTLLIQLEPPPLGTNPNAGGGPRAESRKAAQKAEPEAPREAVQPREIPETPVDDAQPPETPVTVADAEPAGPEAGASGDGDGSGSGPGPGTEPGIHGVPWGKPGGQGPITNGPGDDDAPKLITTSIEAPVLLVRVEPTYPEIARASHTQGMVILEGVIGTDGRIESVRVLKSSPLLDAAARRAVEQWVYRPARQAGRPVKVYITIRVEFRLD